MLGESPLGVAVKAQALRMSEMNNTKNSFKIKVRFWFLESSSDWTLYGWCSFKTWLDLTLENFKNGYRAERMSKEEMGDEEKNQIQDLKKVTTRP